MRSQAQAATSVAAMTLLSTMLGAIIACPIVAATLRLNIKKATKLKKAAQITAICGLSTRVDTTVATELAASWKPFRKSKASASAINRQATNGNCAKGTLPKLMLLKKCMSQDPLTTISEIT